MQTKISDSITNIFIFILLLLFTNNVFASELGSNSKMEIPRFVSVKSNDANLRIGPSKKYPIILKFIIKNYPLEILDEHKDWRYVIDFEKNKGWIHKSLLKGDRNGILINKDNKYTNVYSYPEFNIIGKIYNGNLFNIHKCKIDWCFIEIEDHKGWIKKSNIWGVYKSEIYKDSWFQFIEDIYWKQVFFILRIFKYFNV